MNIALIGYGKMGKTIEKLIPQRGHEVVARFGSEGMDEYQLKKADVAIEFTRPEAAFGNIATCIELGVPVVIGTTGWLAKYDEAVRLCKENNGGLLYASNFSLGVNIFFEMNRKLAAIMNAYDRYDVNMEEIHHTEKRDAPSGTAITLAEQIIENMKRKEGWTLEEAHAPKQIPIEAKRIENVSGTHVVNYQSEIDSIEIKHTAHSREGFALGAIMAAEYISGKTGIFTMKDVLNF